MDRNILLIILNIINPMAIYLLYSTFLKPKKYSKFAFFSTYFLFNLFTTLTLVFSHSSFWNIFVFLVGMFLLSFLYNGKFFYKFFLVIIIYTLFALIETSLYIIFVKNSEVNLSDLSFDVNLVYVITKLVMLIISIFIFLNFKNRSTLNIPKRLVFFLSIIPILSLFILTFEAIRSKYSDIYLALSFVVFIVINAFVFIIFNLLNKLYSDRLQFQDLEKQFELIESQKVYVKNSTEKLAALEHDLKNKLLPLYYMKDSTSEKLEAYLTKIIGEFSNEFLISKTGVPEIDGVLNAKYEICKRENIDFKLDMNITGMDKIEYRDLSVILGNLLDNAIEACRNVDNKWIKMKVEFTKGALFLGISNSYDGKYTLEDGKFISRKKRVFSGYGLQNIDYLVKKYHGIIQFDPNNKRFRVSLMMFED